MGKVRCPGSIKTTVPEPLERKCPKCGSLVEIWSDEEKADCRCGATVFKDVKMTCVVWCNAAEECVGDIVDVKKIKEEAKKKAASEGNPDFVKQVTEKIMKEKKSD
ncbi:MAG: hypothetical protein MRK01_12705 [Candidatus Scalindua sp.]|nr:hypothetical protein [Candidatus Scalindua sp.]